MSIFFSVYFAIGAVYLITFIPELFDPNDNDSFVNWIKEELEESGSRIVGIGLMLFIIVWLLFWPIVLTYDMICRIRGAFNKKKKGDNNAEYR